MAVPVGGLFSIGFDYKGFCGDADVKLGIEKVFNGLEKYTTSPLNIDKSVYNGALQALEAFFAALASSPVVVPTVGVNANDVFASEMVNILQTHLHPAMNTSAVDAKSFMTTLAASEGVTFSQAIIDKVAANPRLVDLMSRKSNKWKVAFLNSSWLDTVISYLQANWPTIALNIFMALLTFLI